MASTTVYRIISARISPMVELTRWLFERQGLAFREEAHVLGFCALATLPAKGGLHVPVIVTPDGAVWKTARDILDGLDETPELGRAIRRSIAQTLRDSRDVSATISIAAAESRRALTNSFA